jgi:hypothetical protein
MSERWLHIGRLLTNGDPFLAVDSVLRDAWHGFSQDQYDQIVHLSPQDTSIAVGAGRAAVVGADGVVREDSWMEVFDAEDGAIAIVQASGPDYRRVLADAPSATSTSAPSDAGIPIVPMWRTRGRS